MYLRMFVYVADLEARMFFPATLTLFLLLALIPPARTNVIFLPRGQFVPSYNHWTIHLPIDTRTPATFAQKLDYRIGLFKTKFANAITNHRQDTRQDIPDALWTKFLTEYELLDKEMSVTLSVLQHFQDPKTRSKRALLPFVGDALSSLFGTATSRDIDEILSRVNDLSDAQTGILSVMDDSVTLINQTVVDVNDNRRTLNRLVNVTNELTDHMTFLKDKLIDQYTASVINTKMDTAFLDLATAVKNFRDDVLNLETILSLAENGIISRSLLPPSQFQNVLSDIQKSLPQGLALPFDPTKIHDYYTNIHSKVTRGHSGIHVLLTIPLLSVTDHFTVYQIFNVPVPKKEQNQLLLANYEIPETKFAALSDDLLKFVEINDHDMNVYLRRQLPFCPLRQPILNAQTSTLCIPALLTNQTDKVSRNCEKTIRVQKTDPTARYLGNGNWLIISADSTDIDIHCKNGTRVRPSATLTTVSPLTLVTLDLGCSAFSQYFQLPVHFGKDSFLTSYQLTYFNLTLHTTDVWRHIHSDLSLNNMTLGTSLKMLPPSHSRTVTVSLLKAHIEKIQSRAKWHYRTVVPGVSTTVCVLVALGITYCIYRYRWCSRQPAVLTHCLPTLPKNGSETMDNSPTCQDETSSSTRPDPTSEPTQLSRPTKTSATLCSLPWLTRQETTQT